MDQEQLRAQQRIIEKMNREALFSEYLNGYNIYSVELVQSKSINIGVLAVDSKEARRVVEDNSDNYEMDFDYHRSDYDIFNICQVTSVEEAEKEEIDSRDLLTSAIGKRYLENRYGINIAPDEILSEIEERIEKEIVEDGPAQLYLDLGIKL